MSKYKDMTMARASSFYDELETRIEAAIAKGESLPITTLAKELATDLGVEWPQTYQLIRMYLDDRQDLEVGLGPKGGIRPKRVVVDSTTTTNQ